MKSSDMGGRNIEQIRTLWSNVIAVRAPHVLDWVNNPGGLCIPPGNEAIPSDCAGCGPSKATLVAVEEALTLVIEQTTQ